LALSVPSRSLAPARTRAFGLGVALAAHLAIFAGLVLAIQIPRLVEPAPIQFSLVPPLAPETAPRPNRPTPPPRREEAAPTPRAARIFGPEATAPLALPAAPPDAVTRERLLAAPFIPHEPVREGLRTSSGCADADWLKLTLAERDACRQRNHALGADAPTYAVGPSDPVERAYLDRQVGKNAKRQREFEAPPTRPMTPCADSRFSNLGFSCLP
jgi:hypothetical protein